MYCSYAYKRVVATLACYLACIMRRFPVHSFVGVRAENGVTGQQAFNRFCDGNKVGGFYLATMWKAFMRSIHTPRTSQPSRRGFARNTRQVYANMKSRAHGSSPRNGMHEHRHACTTQKAEAT